MYVKLLLGLAFPFLPIAELPGFIAQSKAIGQKAAGRLFRTRIREIFGSSILSVLNFQENATIVKLALYIPRP